MFKTHCIGYSVFDHLEGASRPREDPEWDKVDAVVKQWIYGTLTQSLLQSILKPDSTAADVWKAIQDLFHENKESKAMELDDELRNIVIGDSTIMEYCTRIKSISDLLANIGAPVPERNLVIYALNGLSPKYAHIVTTIRHQKPFPSFLEMRSMLTLEERSMIKDQTRLVQTSHHDNASSPTVLNTEHQNRTENSRGNNSGGRGGGRNHRGGARGGRSGGRGSGRQGRAGGGNQFAPNQFGWGGGFFPWSMTFPTSTMQQRGLLPISSAQQAQWYSSANTRHPHMNHWPTPSSAQQQAFFSTASQPHDVQSVPYLTTQDQPTILPQAFNTLSLQDPGNADWYMDTGATAHLHADTGLPNQTNPPSM